MLSAIRRRLGAVRGDAGITLMELVVSMALTVVIGTMALTFFVLSYRSSDQTTSSTLSTDNVRVAMDSWTALLRVADSPTAAGQTTDRFSTTTPSDVVFWADVNNRSSCSAACTRGALQQIELTTTTDPNNSSCYQLVQTTTANGATSSRRLAGGVSTPAMFSYFDATGAVTTQAANVAMVRITLAAGCGTATAQTYTSSVAITGQSPV